jgi:hypothetical protein
MVKIDIKQLECQTSECFLSFTLRDQGILSESYQHERRTRKSVRHMSVEYFDF